MLRQRIFVPLLIVVLSCAPAWAALSKQFTAPGPQVVFADLAQSPTRQWTLTGLAPGAGRISTQHDKGAGSQPSLWEMRCHLSLTGTNILRADVQFFIATSDGTDVDAGVGTGDAAMSVSAASDQRIALLYAGALPVYQNATNTTMFISFRNIYIPNRYFSLVVFNNTTLPFEASTSKHRCVMQSMPPENQ